METTDNDEDAWKTGIRVVAAADCEDDDDDGCWKNSPTLIEVVESASDEVDASARGTRGETTTTVGLLLAVVVDEVVEAVTGIEEGSGGGGLGERVESSQAVIQPSYAWNSSLS